MRYLLFSICLCGLMLGGCTAAPAAPAQPADDTADATGTLIVTANGEDFVRQGFETKDGWQVQFDHVYVTLADVAAYQTDPPFDASTGDTPAGEAVTIPGPLTLDLAEGDADAAPIVAGEVMDAFAGQYNALGWRMTPAADGPAAGATIALLGTAEKDDASVAFAITDATEYSYNCGEFVGDVRKGVLAAGETADVEATFHFDHVFGDAEAPADDALNVGALGFDPLAALAQGGVLEISTAELAEQLSDEETQKLFDALATLGHVGEGHCYEATGGYTGHSE